MNPEAQVEQAYAAGQRVWPDVALTIEAFRSAPLEVDALLHPERASDFYLACAAGRGEPRAIRHIEELFLTKLGQRIRRLGTAPDEVADVLQVVRERLFTGTSPRIRAYNGAAPLGRWITVFAIRIAIDLHRRQAAAAPRPELLAAEIADVSQSDPQKELMREPYRREFERVIKELLTTLGQRDHTVLRLHLVEGVSLARIAVMYGVHRLTVVRWVREAGETVLNGLRGHFRELGVVLRDFESLAQLVRSQLSLDLARLFPPNA
jgi:RNA polymerase sigma-70 factor (ECF subfamily)